jgi:hypothetical protein
MIPPRPAVIARDKVLRVQTTPASSSDACPCTSPLGLAIMPVGAAFKMSLKRERKIPLGDIQTKSYRSHIAVGFDPTIAC